MKLKLLILLTLITVTNAFSQHHTATLTIPTGTYTPDGSGNMTFETGTLTHEGATFTLQVTIAAKSSIDGDGASTTLTPQGIIADGTSWGVTYQDPNMVLPDDLAQTFDADSKDEATVSSIVVTNFVDNGSGFTDAAITDMYFKSIGIGIANNRFDKVEFEINGGDFINIGKLASTDEIVPFEDEYNNITLSNEAVTSFKLTNNNTNQGGSNRISARSIVIAYKFELSTTWDGDTSSDWTNADNWSNGVPTVNHNAIIPNVGISPIITSTQEAATNDLTVNSGASVTIESGGALIVEGASSGDVTYQVTANDTNWHLLASPVVGAAYDGTWVDVNDIDNTTRTVGTNVGIGTYANTGAAEGTWTYATDAAESGTFTNGQGYSFKRDATSNAYLSFTGTVKTDNLTSTINQNAGNWNFVGNPFSSYILVSDLLNINADNLTDTHENVYVWNGSAYTALATTDYIHPGQGFFVSADNSNASNFTINSRKISGQTGVTLYKGASKTAITLSINDGTNIKTTEINFSDDKTTGLDPRFDVGTFTGTTKNLDVYTQLVSDNEGVAFMRQSLPNSDYESMIVPVGIKAAANKEITFSATSLNLPSGVKVVLEDRANNVFTNLDDGNYKITLTEAADGGGRFYLHTSSKSVLSVDDNVALNSISIYKTTASTLRIAGLQQGDASVKLYNILGKQVLNSSFEANGVKDIALPQLATGVYIVQLQTASGSLSKKIIME
ncbi:T9SS type A sorting domain-containing protein [Polaribacter sp. Asnod6-C07]|uniref:T9SS type A sorting domain-containing protein n=1 Tax=Polaribacter sp. Asnod6-C07 TaxID=3160582 RepID=UPI00386852F4